jgi:hypothetical protein
MWVCVCVCVFDIMCENPLYSCFPRTDNRSCPSPPPSSSPSGSAGHTLDTCADRVLLSALGIAHGDMLRVDELGGDADTDADADADTDARASGFQGRRGSAASSESLVPADGKPALRGADREGRERESSLPQTSSTGFRFKGLDLDRLEASKADAQSSMFKCMKSTADDIAALYAGDHGGYPHVYVYVTDV